MTQDFKAFRIQLKPASIQKARAWAQMVNSRQGEALESLRREGITIEAAFLDHLQGEDHLVYLLKGDIEGAKKASAASTAAIDMIHQEFKATCWQSVLELEPLAWLESP